MDIRSIIDSEDTPPSRKSSAPTPTKQDYRPIPPRPPTGYGSEVPVYDGRREFRPPQPTPLQTHEESEHSYPNGPFDSTLTHMSLGRHNSSIDPNNEPYPLPQSVGQSPNRAYPAPQYAQPDAHPASAATSNRSFGHSTPLSQTPTSSTPSSAGTFSKFPRPTSHSIPTPSSAQYPPSVLRESPQPSQVRHISQSYASQQCMSQPGTPLGPPSTFRRTSFNPVRELPGNYDRQRNLSGGPLGLPQSATPSPATAGSPQTYMDQYPQASMHGFPTPREREKSLSVSPKTRSSSLPYVDQREHLEATSNRAPQWNGNATTNKRKVERERSDFAIVEPPRLNRMPSSVISLGVNGLLNAKPSDETLARVNYKQGNDSPRTDAFNCKSYTPTQSQVSQPPLASQPHPGFIPQSRLEPSTPKSVSVPGPVTHRVSTPPNSEQIKSEILSQTLSSQESPKSANLRMSVAYDELDESPSQSVKKIAHWQMAANPQAQPSLQAEDTASHENATRGISEPVKKKARLEASLKDPTSPSVEKPSVAISSVTAIGQPPKMKPPRISRWQDIPIFAQSVRGPKRTAELFALSHKRHGMERGVLPSNQIPNGTQLSQIPGQSNGVSNTNYHKPLVDAVRIPVAQPSLANNGPLGPWEPSILNIIPSEELTRVISDWLFENVVLREDVGVGPAGGAADQGAVLEIEAKIGQLMDKNTNDRIRIPVLNECVVSHTDPNLKIAFKSSMTEAQHRTLNQFLNKALVDSKQPPKAGSTSPSNPRIPMSYKHTYETDTFYEISQAGALQLPRSIASGVQYNPRAVNKSKVRITTDQKTGKEIAKIIKARVADIDIYSPRTAFDWRISVNVEMNFDGDMRGLVETDRKDGKKADRNKDRMSYKHLAYQIDLTQVTPAEATSKTDKEHELEIEVSSEEVRRQGLLAQSGQISQYEDLIRGFVDNVRVLARHCQS